MYHPYISTFQLLPYKALLGLTGPYWALLGLTGTYWDLLGPYWALLEALLGLTRPY